MLKIMVGIYKITSPSGKVYIGQTWNFHKRKKDYRNMKEKRQIKLFNSFQKYGFDSHEMKVVHELPNDVSQETLNTYEQVYMDAYRDCGIELLNLKEAGSNGKFSEELKKMMSETKKGMGKGTKQSDEWKSKRAASMTGNKNWLGKKHSEETKFKMSCAAIGKQKSDDHKLKNIENFKKATAARIKHINQYDLDGNFIKEWPSQKDIELAGVALARSVCNACKGIYKTANGFKWAYKN